MYEIPNVEEDDHMVVFSAPKPTLCMSEKSAEVEQAGKMLMDIENRIDEVRSVPNPTFFQKQESTELQQTIEKIVCARLIDLENRLEEVRPSPKPSLFLGRGSTELEQAIENIVCSRLTGIEERMEHLHALHLNKLEARHMELLELLCGRRGGLDSMPIQPAESSQKRNLLLEGRDDVLVDAGDCAKQDLKADLTRIEAKRNTKRNRKLQSTRGDSCNASTSADAGSGHEGIKFQLFQTIDSCFDACARAQQSLQRQVKDSVMDIFNKHPGAMSTDQGGCDEKAEKSLLPVDHHLAMSSSQSLKPVGPTDAEGEFGIRNASGCEVCEDTKHDDDGLDQALIGETDSTDCLYLATSGRFVSSRIYAEMPRWQRLAERILNSNSDMVAKLANHWTKGIHEQRVSSLVDGIVLRAKFLINIEKAYRHVSRVDKGRRRRRKSFRSAKRYVWQKVMSFFPIHPGSGSRLVWDILCLAICLYDVIILPMTIFDFGRGGQLLKDALELYGAIFWTLDILMCFCTAHFDGNTMQTSFQIIALSYIRSWFCIDFTIVVNDWVAVLANNSSFRALRAAKFIKTFVRGIRLIRLWKLSSHYRMALQRMNSEYALSIVKIGTQAFFVAIMCHYVGCGWYALHVLGSSERTWVDEYISPDATTIYRYSSSLQWALTQVLPASIKIQPVNTPERVYNTIIILIAMVVFSSFVSSITVSMNHLRACRLSAIEREFQLRRFLAENNISNELSHTIWGFIRKSTRNKSHTTKPGDVLALQTLPEHIVERVYTDLFLWRLRKHPFFDFYSQIEPICMAKVCRTCVTVHTMLSQDVLWHDLIVDGMLFVTHGMLSYNVEGEEFIVEPGEWCCEEALWSETPRIDVPFSAGDFGCELLMVDPVAFQAVAIKYPQDMTSYRFISRYGEEFTRSFNAASHTVEYWNLLFNDKSTTLEILEDVFAFFSSSCEDTEEDSEQDD